MKEGAQGTKVRAWPSRKVAVEEEEEEVGRGYGTRADGRAVGRGIDADFAIPSPPILLH